VKWLLIPLVVMGLTGCKHDGSPGHASLMDTIQESTRPNRNAGLSSDVGGAALVEVEHTPGMLIRSREAALEKFPCQSCHIDLAKVSREQRKAHWQVELKHASETVMQCSTCHFETDVNRLRTIAGKPVGFDHSYQICGQCHSKQAEDWAGGAHGKRVGGWAPPRVAQTCVECHNPHSPGWSKRWPAVAGRARFGNE